MFIFSLLFETALSNKSSMFEYKKIEVNPCKFFENSFQLIDNKSIARKSWTSLLDDSNIDLDNIFNCNLQDFVINFSVQYINTSKDIIRDASKSSITKNEIVWIYKNLSGLCNLSALMYAQYVIFIISNYDELCSIYKNNKDIDLENKITEFFKKSTLSDINEALYYGQTVLALVLYTREAFSYDNNKKSIVKNHPFTHFNSLSEIEPYINYKEQYNKIIDGNIYIHPNKKDIINNFIINNTGFYKVIESGHACFLYLDSFKNKAIYINNSLFTKEPLVCNKDELVDKWISIKRWNKERINYDDFDCISLFDVIRGFQKININELNKNIENYVNNNNKMLTGGYIPYFGTTCIVLISILIVIIIVHFVLLNQCVRYRRLYVKTFIFPGLHNYKSTNNANYKEYLSNMYNTIST